METPVPPGETEDERDIRENKDIAAFSYVWIMSVIIYALKKDSKFIRYHSKQATLLFVLSILVAMIPYLGRYLVFLVVAGMLLGFVHAAQGHYADVPFVGKLAKGELTIADVWKQLHEALSAILRTFKTIFKTSTKEEEKKPESPPTTPVPSGSIVPNPSSSVPVDPEPPTQWRDAPATQPSSSQEISLEAKPAVRGPEALSSSPSLAIRPRAHGRAGAEGRPEWVNHKASKPVNPLPPIDNPPLPPVV